MKNRADFNSRLISSLHLFSLPITLMLIAPSLNDVFSLPKFLVLCVLGLILLFAQTLIFNKENFMRHRTAFILVFLFISSHLFLSLTTEQTYRALVGYYGRNNGFIEYLIFAIFLVSVSISANKDTIQKILVYFNVAVTIIAIYAIFQSYNLDFIDYNSGEFSEVTTLGNVNFSSALIGLSVPISLWKILSSHNSRMKIYYLTLLITNLIGLMRINSTQGKILSVLGSTIFLGLWVYHRNKTFFKFYSLGFLTISIFSLMGLFQKGLFKNLVYESSISFRGDYFRAAWKMFLSDPLRGVGIESFSDFYLRNTDLATIGRVGAESTTKYAHNIFLQFMATGGLILTLPYLILVIYISLKAIRLPMRISPDERFLSYTLVTIWFLYLTQLQISIEHPVLGLLAWLVAGSILNLSAKLGNASNVLNSINITNFRQKKFHIAISAPILIGILFLASNSLVADSNLSKFNASMKPNLQDFQRNIHSHNPFENYYKINASVALANSGNLKDSYNLLVEATNRNPSDFDATYILAQVSNLLGERDMEILYRNRSFVLNPYLDDNIYKLGMAYKELNQISELKNLIRVVSARPGSSNISAQLAGLG